MTGDSAKDEWEDGAASGSGQQLVDQPLAERQGDGVGLVGRAEFFDDVVDVKRHGAFGDGQCDGHFRSGFAMRGQGQNFHFASRERPFGDVNGRHFGRNRDDNRADGVAA